MIGAEGEYRNLEGATQLNHVVRIVIQHDPSNSRCHGRARHLRKGCAPRGFEHDGVGTRHPRILNVMQQLLALRQSIIAGVNDLNVHTKTPCRFFCRRCLFLLIIVIVISERNHKGESFHEGHLFRNHSP